MNLEEIWDRRGLYMSYLNLAPERKQGTNKISLIINENLAFFQEQLNCDLHIS